MNHSSRDIALGVFVLLGLLCTAYLTIQLGRMEVLGGTGYELQARFTSIAGLRVGAGVEIAGVSVGRVSHIELDTKLAQAVVTLYIDQGVEVSEDSIASVRTSGLIGDKYVSLGLGGSDTLLGPGEEITDTESAVDLESIIGKFAFGGV